MPDHRAPAATQDRTRPPSARTYRCSFCGKSGEQVERIIAGPNVYICNECVTLCNEIIAQGKAEDTTR